MFMFIYNSHPKTYPYVCPNCLSHKMDWYANEYCVFPFYISPLFLLAVRFPLCIPLRGLLISVTKLCWPFFPNPNFCLVSFFFESKTINCKFASVFQSTNYTYSSVQNSLYVTILCGYFFVWFSSHVFHCSTQIWMTKLHMSVNQFSLFF